MSRTCMPGTAKPVYPARYRDVWTSAPVLLVVVIGGFLPFLGCASSHAGVAKVQVPPEVVSSPSRFRKEYILAPGDQIEVAVWRVPEVSRLLVIRPDGFISLPMLNDVKAAGMTPNELGAKLTELFSARLVSPEVTVIANQVRQPEVYVEGDVNTPVLVPLRNATTAMQAIAYAGGFRRTAANRDIAIIRLTDDGYLQAIPVPAPVGGQPGPYMALQATLLQADDIVFVPESGRSQFGRFVDDFITRPGAGINQLLGTYLNFRLVQIVSKQ